MIDVCVVMQTEDDESAPLTGKANVAQCEPMDISSKNGAKLVGMEVLISFEDEKNLLFEVEQLDLNRKFTHKKILTDTESLPREDIEMVMDSLNYLIVY